MSRILDELSTGLEEGRRYSASPNAKERAAWLVVQRHVPTANEMQCKQIIKNLLEDSFLHEGTYHNKVRGEKEKGLFVNSEKMTKPPIP